jgi:phosphatidylinositol alpha 1,6-mannosyltransferase
VERLEALATRSGTRLVLVGDGPSRAALERRLGPRGATFLGRLDGEQLATAYAVLDVFAHTGTAETFGQTLQEAIASGVPVVAPAAGGPLDTVEHGSTGLLYAPDDDRDLRRCVDLLVDDQPRRLAMGESGRRAALTRSWDSVCDQLMAHYDSVTAARALPIQPV